MDEDELLGVVGLAVMVVRSSDTSLAQGGNDLPLIATSAIHNLIESACSAALSDHIAFGESSITTKILIEMETSVSVGEELQASARCVEVSEGNITFEAEITRREKQIATARVQRRLVDRLSYLARIAAERLM